MGGCCVEQTWQEQQKEAICATWDQLDASETEYNLT